MIRSTSERLRYEYEPEVDEIISMSEIDMERYFSAKSIEMDAENIVDSLMKQVNYDVPDIVDHYNRIKSGMMVRERICSLLSVNGIPISFVETMLDIDLSIKGIVKGGVTKDPTQHPIYISVLRYLPKLKREFIG